MKKAFSLLVFLALSIGAHATTYYVNGNGDTRFSSNVSSGHCDGTSPQSYAAAGGTGAQTNLHCAFKDIRSLWSDGTFAGSVNGTFPSWGWLGAGGDTYLIDCTGGALCRVGQSGPNSGDWFGLAGDPFNAGAPSPIAGTSGAHTRILAICTQTVCNNANLAHVSGGYGVTFGFNLTNTSFVDVQGFDLTDHSHCQRASGNANFCNAGFPLDDFMKNGIVVNNSSHDIFLSDLNIHGTAVAGMMGAPCGTFSLTRVTITGNPSSGWNMDDGSGQTGCGNTTMSQVNIYGNGFVEEYPITGAVTMPWGTMGGMNNGASQSSGGGYGDGIGTTSTQSVSAWHIVIDRSIVACNAQDGADLLHDQGPSNSVKITRSLFYCNMGQQIKIGSENSTLQNNVINGNCQALNQTSPAPLGFLPGYNTNDGFSADMCRPSGGGTTVAIAVTDAGPTFIQNNTVFSGGDVVWEIDAPISPETCTAACQLVFQGNLTVGFATSLGNPPGNGQSANPIFLVDVPSNIFSNAGSTNDHNTTYGGNQACPNSALSETNAFCPGSGPQLVDLSFHQVDYGNYQPSSNTSNILGKGLTISGLTVDYNGTTRPSPPAAGAFEFGSGSSTPPPPPPPSAVHSGAIVLMGNRH